MPTNELETALAVFRVLETGDRDLAHVTAAPSFTNREATVAPLACSIEGPRGLLASSAWMRSAFDDLRFPVLDAAFEDGVAWVRLRMQGVHRRPFVQYRDGVAERVLPATGRSIDFEQIHMLHVSGQGVTRHEAVRDDVTMLGQLGAFPPAPAMVLRLIGARLSGSAGRAGREVAAAAEAAAA